MLVFTAGLFNIRSVFATKNIQLRLIAMALFAGVALGGCGGGGGGGGGGGSAPDESSLPPVLVPSQIDVAPQLTVLDGLPATAVAGGSALPLVSTVPAGNAFPASATTWSVTPAGLGGMSSVTGATSSYVPPVAGTVSATTTVVVSATLNGHSTSFEVTLYAKAPWLSLLAGSPNGPGNLNGVGTVARFDRPMGIAVDSSGNVFVADSANATVRRISLTGDVSVLAGKAGETGYTNGTGATARFGNPFGVSTDAAGNVYVADGSMVRKITLAGVVTTLAGSVFNSASVDGTGAGAGFGFPVGGAVDSSGNVYVADKYSHTIRKISPLGVVTTVAGATGSAGSTDGTGSAARFWLPSGVATDSADNVYVADSGNATIRKVTPTGVVTTFAGIVGNMGSNDGTTTTARLSPAGVTTDGSGNVYVVGGSTIRKITSAGLVTTLAGVAGVVGAVDGPGATARFDSLVSASTDAAGNIYVADNGNNTIRKISPTGVVSTLAGMAAQQGATDSAGVLASFCIPRGIATDGAGNLYVADTANNIIRKVSPAGVVTTFAGTAGVRGSADGLGAAASFYGPTSVATDSFDNVYVTDSENSTIRKILPNGMVITLAGAAGAVGSVDGVGSAARFRYPAGIATDAASNVYVADSSDNTIRKVTSGGVVTTLAGTAGVPGTTDGMGTAALFAFPAGLVVDSTGNVYVADNANNVIRKITPAGVVTRFAGGFLQGSADGVGAAASFKSPGAMTIDSAGNIYVADVGNSLIRKITHTGVVSTVAGRAGVRGFIPGVLPGTLTDPLGIAFFGNTLYTTTNNAIVQIANLP